MPDQGPGNPFANGGFSSIPPPKNITEIGGYLNLLETLNQPEMRLQLLAAILGVNVPAQPTPYLNPNGMYAKPVLLFVDRPNDRPVGPQQAAIALRYSVRSDFAPALDAAMKDIHDHGCQVPILPLLRTLPPANSLPTLATGMLAYLGRSLSLVPSAALSDPDQDPLAVARPAAGGSLQVVARPIDPKAPKAAEVVAANWAAWKCDATSCKEVSANRAYLALAPILNAAGWYQSVPATPTSLTNFGSWPQWTNITGLVPGVTRFGDELRLLYSEADILSSSLRDRLQWVWNGIDFAAPSS